MFRTLASTLLLIQLGLLAAPALHSHALQESAPTCAAVEANHTEHLVPGPVADGLVQAPADCEHCGVPDCGAMLGCAGATIAAVQSPQPMELPAVSAVAEIAASVSPMSSVPIPILPPPRA